MVGGSTLRLALVLPLALSLAWVLPACGSSRDGQAGGGSAGPSASPPTLKGSGPPLAWVESSSDRVWMAYSSYCWGQACADYAQPTERTDVPVVRTTLGSKMVFHLGFDPPGVGLQIAAGAEPLELTGRGRDRIWTVDRSALLVLNATDAADEQASYVVKVTLGSEPSP